MHCVVDFSAKTMVLQFGGGEGEGEKVEIVTFSTSEFIQQR